MNEHYLLLPHLKVHDANAFSSSVTIGFPAVTAWMGFSHALQRKLQNAGFEELLLTGVGICSHDFDLQTYRGAGDYVHSIVGTANPLGKDGNRQSFIEEPRCHLTASLLIKADGISKSASRVLFEKIPSILHRMKLAGGDILSFSKPEISDVYDINSQRKTLRKLMPGYVLIERRELLADAMVEGANALDGLLDYLTIKHRSEIDENGVVSWRSTRRHPGWIIPIATGFHGVSDLAAPGETKNVRDQTVPHRFAEAVVTLGEFIMPYRLHKIEDVMWHYRYESENNLYLCVQNKTLTAMKEQ